MVDHQLDQSPSHAPQAQPAEAGDLHASAILDTDPSLTDASDVAKALHVDPAVGLSSQEAKRRKEKFGPNQLASAPPVPKWKKFLAQFRDPLVYLLLVATAISLVAWFIERANAQPGSSTEALPFDAIVIVLILIVNAVLGYIQEAKAEQAVAALASMTAPQTSVLRDGQVMRIDTSDVVPGDILILGEGDSVSADGRLLAAASLRIAEASLTGESVPVAKKPETLDSAKALGDRMNMVFNGTSVTQGTGRAIVTGTGMDTQVGKIADMLSRTEDEQTPLQKEMAHVSKVLGIAVCIIAAVVLAALAIMEGFHSVDDVIESLLLAVSLAVAAVPEGLAAILTVVLALGVQRMAKHHAIVKKLSSVETLGSASVICSDKTGTLTRNEMTVERVVTPSGEVQLTGTGYAPEGRMIAVGAADGDLEVPADIRAEVYATLGAGAMANDGNPLEAMLVTEHLKYSLPYRALFARNLRTDTAERLIDALAVLMVRLHLAGFYWGDVSLSNVLFLRDADAYSAFLVDAETGDLHANLTEGQREYDIDLAHTNIIGELMDLSSGKLLPGDVDEVEVGNRLVDRYHSLWSALTDVETFNPDEMWKIEKRVNKLNELGFDVDELEVKTAADGTHVLVRPRVVDAGYASRKLMRLTGLDVQENQARRLLNDLDTYRASTWRQNEDLEVVATDWMREVYEPTVRMIPPEYRSQIEPAQFFHEVLDHRWFLAEHAGHDIPMAEAVQSYVKNVLPQYKLDKKAMKDINADADSGVIDDEFTYADDSARGQGAEGEGAAGEGDGYNPEDDPDAAVWSH